MKNFEYRIYPTKKQERTMNGIIHILCYVFNSCLQEVKRLYEKGEKYPGKFGLCSFVKSLNIKDVHSQVIQNICERVDLAFQAFFRRVRAGETPGYPRFKSKDRYNSFCFPQFGFKLIDEKRLKLSKIGHVKIVLHRPLEGIVKRLTIKKSSTGKWFAVFTCSTSEKAPLPIVDKEVGIDLGLKTFATFSDGNKIDNPRFFKSEEKALAKAQRAFDKVKDKHGEEIRRKKKRAISKIHERISNKRDDFAWKQAKHIVQKYDTIVVEDLNIQNMVERKKFSKSILDVSWNSFIQKLIFKAEEAGRKVIKIDPKNTSKTCNQCGYIKTDLTLADRVYICPICNHKENRDLNASKNILRRGLSSLGIKT